MRSAWRSARSTAAPFAELAARLRGMQAEVSDVEHELRLAVEQVTEDPERIEAVRARRRQLHDLGRKYGDTLADVVAYGRDVSARLAELESYEERAAAIDARTAMPQTPPPRPARPCPEPGSRRPRRSPVGSRSTCTSWRCPTRRWRCSSNRASPPTTVPTG